jgi:hypothetical protein
MHNYLQKNGAKKDKLQVLNSFTWIIIAAF